MTLVPTHLRELPRAVLMSHWQVFSSPEQVLAAMSDPAFDPERVVLLESDPGLAAVDSDQPGTVSVTDVSTDELEVHADVERPAVLLITDNYSAGWKATPLPGSSARSYRVLPANYTLRAIPLTAGSHHFRLEYRPDGFVVGRWVTVLSLLVYAAVSAGQVWRRGVRSAVRIDQPERGR